MSYKKKPDNSPKFAWERGNKWMVRYLYLSQLLEVAGIDASNMLEMSKQDIYELLDMFSPDRDKG